MRAFYRLGTGSMVVISVVLGALVSGVSGCSSGGGTSGTGGSGGATGKGGAGGGNLTGTGGAGMSTDGGVDRYIPPVNPLCPSNGPIVQGSTPLPDGVEIVATVGDSNSGIVNLRDMIVAGGYVYWTTETTIMRVPVTGGTPAKLLDRSSVNNVSIGWLQVDSNSNTLYFTEVGPDQVAKMPADGSGAPTTIAKRNSPWQLVLANGVVYFYDGAYGEIDRVPATGGTPTPMVLGVAPSDGMTVANGYLYFINPRSNSFDVHLVRVPITATAPPADAGTTIPDGGSSSVPPPAEDVVVTDNYDTNGVVSDGTSLYWDQDNMVMKAPLGAHVTSTALATLPDHSGDFGTSDTTYVGSVVVDSGMLYWSSELSCSDIVRAATDGSGQTPIVHQVAFPAYLAVDATHVYWLAANSQILRAPR